jgi:hypothetical protein
MPTTRAASSVPENSTTAPGIRTVDPRDERARGIAADAGQWIKARFADGRKAYGVPSQSQANVYYLTDGRSCTCPDYQKRQQPCKHARAVKLHCARVKAQQQPRPAVDPETARLAAKYDAIFGTDT